MLELVYSPKLVIAGRAPCAAASIVVRSLAASPRKQQKEPMKVLVWRRGRSRVIHQPPKSRQRSRSPC